MRKKGAMSFVEAAEAVLRMCGRPMTAREITEEAVKHGLLESSGRTPHVTMNARLYTVSKSPEAPIARLSEPGRRGTGTAAPGTVRWALRG